MHIQQKVIKYSSVQKLEMFFVALLAGAKAVSHSNLTLRADPALYRAFGLSGCADQASIAHTLDAATEADVSALREAVAETFRRFSQTRRHNFSQDGLVLDLALSPLPTSRHAEGATRGYMGRCRSKTGRKLVRVRAVASQETVWETVGAGNMVETLAVVQEAIIEAERLLGLEGEEEVAQTKRARTEIRLDGGWGTTEIITWLLERGYQVTGKFKSTSRVRKLVREIIDWQPTSSPGREVAPVLTPLAFVRPLAQYAVRTLSKGSKDGYYYAVVFSTHLDLPMTEVVSRYDGRAGVEADLKGDKRGLALAVIRKRRLAAQKVVVLLTQLAHNVLLWSRQWLAAQRPGSGNVASSDWCKKSGPCLGESK